MGQQEKVFIVGIGEDNDSRENICVVTQQGSVALGRNLVVDEPGEVALGNGENCLRLKANGDLYWKEEKVDDIDNELVKKLSGQMKITMQAMLLYTQNCVTPSNLFVSSTDDPSETLPKINFDDEKDLNESEPVIVLCKNGEIYKAVLAHWYESESKDDTYFYFTDVGEMAQGAEEVVGWMPIPKSTI